MAGKAMTIRFDDDQAEALEAVAARRWRSDFRDHPTGDRRAHRGTPQGPGVSEEALGIAGAQPSDPREARLVEDERPVPRPRRRLFHEVNHHLLACCLYLHARPRQLASMRSNGGVMRGGAHASLAGGSRSRS